MYSWHRIAVVVQIYGFYFVPMHLKSITLSLFIVGSCSFVVLIFSFVCVCVSLSSVYPLLFNNIKIEIKHKQKQNHRFQRAQKMVTSTMRNVEWTVNPFGEWSTKIVNCTYENICQNHWSRKWKILYCIVM